MHEFSIIHKTFIIVLMRFLHSFLRILAILSNEKWLPAHIKFWKCWNENLMINFAWRKLHITAVFYSINF